MRVAQNLVSEEGVPRPQHAWILVLLHACSWKTDNIDKTDIITDNTEINAIVSDNTDNTNNTDITDITDSTDSTPALPITPR